MRHDLGYQQWSLVTVCPGTAEEVIWIQRIEGYNIMGLYGWRQNEMGKIRANLGKTAIVVCKIIVSRGMLGDKSV